MAPTEPHDGQIHSERQKSRLNKRKAVSDSLTSTREELFAGEWDRYAFKVRVCVLLADILYHRFHKPNNSEWIRPILDNRKSISIPRRISTYRRPKSSYPGRSISSFSQFTCSWSLSYILQVLSELQAKIRSLPGFLGPSVSEAWLRRYQVTSCF